MVVTFRAQEDDMARVGKGSGQFRSWPELYKSYHSLCKLALFVFFISFVLIARNDVEGKTFSCVIV